MSVDATILVKTLDGQFKCVSVEDIEQVHVNHTGEKMVFFKGGYGIEIDTDEALLEKELVKFVKDTVVHVLKRHGRAVDKVCEESMEQWFSGFWLSDKALLLGECTSCAERLARYAMEEHPEGTVKVGNIRLDKTFHDDRGEFYYNFGLEIGGVK